MTLRMRHIMLFIVLSHTSFGAARLTGTLFALSNKASAFTVGVQMALFALMPALLAVRAGRWLDTSGPYRPLLLGTSLMTAGALLPALFPYEVADIGPLLVASALLGTGFMYVQITAQHIVGTLAAPDRRPAAFSMLALAFSTSGLIAPVGSGFLIDSIGHRATLGCIFLVLAVGLGLLVTQRGRLPRPPPQRGDHAASNPFELFRIREVRHVLIVSGMISMAWDLQTFMIPVYGTRIGLSASQIGVIIGAFAAATFVIRLAMPALSRRFSEWQVLVFTLLTSGLAYGLMPLFSTAVPLMVVMFLLGLGLGAAQPNVMSLLHERSPEGRVGEALGLRTIVMNSSHIVLPLVIGAFGTVLGAAPAFWLMATALVGGGWSAHRWTRDGPKRP
ncbi:MAG: MFS transporter [Burkholderiaceae bacterium]